MKRIDEALDTAWNKHKSNAGVAHLYKHKLSIAWVLSIIIVVLLGKAYQGKATMFQGIAEATETTISLPSPTEVVKVYVMPGQSISAGDTIVVLNRPDLNLRITELTRELDVIEGRSNVSGAEIDQKVAEVKADLAARSTTLKAEIRNLESEYQKNKEIAASLQSLKGTGSVGTESDAIALRIKSLKNELSVLQANANSQIKLLKNSRNLQKDAGKTEAENLKKELAEVMKQKDELVQIAKEEWVVSSVNARDGEKISSFAPIVTLTHKSPTMIRGYIHERMYQRMDIGERVKIHTLGGTGSVVEGQVIGLSSRIVEFPTRMWKMPEMPIHGREVIITISEDNPFLLGEMVTISE